MSSWTSGTFETDQQRASGLLGRVRAGGTSTPDLDAGIAYRATRHTASMARDADDLAHLLALLGMDASMGKTGTEEAAA